jgi:hypothetical protein
MSWSAFLLFSAFLIARVSVTISLTESAAAIQLKRWTKGRAAREMRYVECALGVK